MTVPTRAFRVLALSGDKVFRVEQLSPGSCKWRPLSTHHDDKPFEAFPTALASAINDQMVLMQAIKQRREAGDVVL